MSKHPITPPPELVQQWNQEAVGTHFEPFGYAEFIAARAAQWGADMELESCRKWLAFNSHDPLSRSLQAARRPKPPTLKEQALRALDHLCVNHTAMTDHEKTIRSALESL